MSFRMSIPYLGLTRKEDETGKHKAYGEGICKEAGVERASRSRTLDRTLSDRNVYEGIASGDELWRLMCERADAYRIQVEGRTRDGKKVVRERGLRKDAIVGFAVIFKPPTEVIASWSREERERFFKDCHEVAETLEPELFQRSNVLMRSRHMDEDGEHEHDIGIPIDGNGHYNGSDMLNHMRDNFNQNFAAEMRKRGWDMDDLELYDAERAKTDIGYLEERRERRRKQGQSVNEYAANDLRHKAELASKAVIDANARALEAERDRLKAEQEALSARQAMERTKWARDQYAGHSYMTQSGKTALGVDGLKVERERLKSEIDSLERQAENAKEQVELARREASEVNAALLQRQHELDERERRMREMLEAELEQEREALNEQREAYENACNRLDEVQDGVTIEDVVHATVNEIEEMLNEPDGRTPLGKGYLSNAKRALKEAFEKVRSWFDVETIAGGTRLEALAYIVKDKLVGKKTVDISPIGVSHSPSYQRQRDEYEYIR